MVWYEYVIGGMLLVSAIAIILFILLQEGRRSGIAGAISGGAETFLSKNKAKSLSGKLAKFTRIIFAIFAILVIAMALISLYRN